MAKIQDANFYVTYGWMITKLKLSGRALQVYAIIYGFTQDQETEFNGSLNYIAGWLGTSNRHTVLRAIDNLIEKGLIEKRQAVFNGVTINKYVAIVPDFNGLCRNGTGCAETAQGVCRNGTGGCAETAQGVCRNGTGGCAETAHNIYINKNIDKNMGKDIDKNSTPAREKAPAAFNAPAVVEATTKEPQTPKTQKHAYGQYKNVMLSDHELETLKNEYPMDYQKRIEAVSEYCASHGKSYKNYLATIRVWARKDKEKQANQQFPQFQQPHFRPASSLSLEERVQMYMTEDLNNDIFGGR